MHVQTFGRFPIARMTRAGRTDHLHLAVDWPSERSARHGQEGAGIDVPQLNWLIALPNVGRTLELPVVARIADAVLTVGGDFLIARQR